MPFANPLDGGALGAVVARGHRDVDPRGASVAGDRDLHGVDAVILPGGFSYGDYLRAGAIARFAAPTIARPER